LAFGTIIIGIVVYTVNLPKTADELNTVDGRELPCTPVSFRSLSCGNSGDVNDSAAAEAQVATSDDSAVSCTDQMMNRHDSVTSPPANDCMKSQQH